MFDAYVSFWAKAKPQALAVTGLGTNITYAQFDRDILRFAAGLAQMELPAAGVVGVRLRNHYAHWLTLMALSRLGIASASVPPGEPSAQRVLPVIRPDLLLSDSPTEGACPVALLTSDWIAQTLSTDAAVPPRRARDAEAVGRVSTSSGTTGTPKPIPFSWRLVVERAQRRAAMDLSGNDASLVIAGTDTNFGFSQRLAAWIAGATVVMGPEIQRLPDALPALRPTVLTLSPGALYMLVEALPPDFLPIPGLRIRIGGGAVSQRVARKAQLQLSPDVQMLYSSTEGGSVARGPVSPAHPGSVGYRLPWAEVEVLDADGSLCPPGVEGELRVRSPEMVTGYVGDGGSGGQAFRNGWFHPGDIGMLMPDGEIRISGRIDAVMNLGGVKLMPSVVEEVLQTAPGVIELVVFSAPTPDAIDALWVAVVASSGFDRAEMRARLRAAMPALPPLHIAVTDVIPRNDAGKLDRRRLRDMVANAQAMKTPLPAERA